jgi:hypothetical protein
MADFCPLGHTRYEHWASSPPPAERSRPCPNPLTHLQKGFAVSGAVPKVRAVQGRTHLPDPWIWGIFAGLLCCIGHVSWAPRCGGILRRSVSRTHPVRKEAA